MDSYTQQMNFFGNSNPEELIKKYGSPLFVYNEDILRRQMRRVAGLLPNHRFTSNFSIKTNSNLSILKIANEEGLNADAMSPGEIYALKKAGFPSERIFYVSNNVSEEEMQYAIDEGVIVSVDSLSQLEMFGKLNPGGRLSVRINPGVGAGHHEKVVTAGKKTKFGVAAADIEKIRDVASKYDLHIIGLNQHVGSLFMDYKPFLEACRNFLHYAEEFDELEFLDFGGGFGTPYHKLADEEEFDIETFKKELDALLTEWKKNGGKDVLFKTEPGRYVVAEGGVLLGQVHAVKENYGHKYIGTDIINELSQINDKISQDTISMNYAWADDVIQQCYQNNIKILPIYDPLYPRKLKELSNPPSILYLLGNIKLLEERIIAIIGTRHSTPL